MGKLRGFMKFNVGDKVVCNGNTQSQVIAVEEWSKFNIVMVTIRLWDEFRLVGEVQMSESALAAQQPQN